MFPFSMVTRVHHINSHSTEVTTCKEALTLGNMEPLLQRIKTNLDKWEKLKLTLWDKINVIKMVALQFIYLSERLPVNIEPYLFKQYDRFVTEFNWTKRDRG